MKPYNEMTQEELIETLVDRDCLIRGLIRDSAAKVLDQQALHETLYNDRVGRIRRKTDKSPTSTWRAYETFSRRVAEGELWDVSPTGVSMDIDNVRTNSLAAMPIRGVYKDGVKELSRKTFSLQVGGIDGENGQPGILFIMQVEQIIYEWGHPLLRKLAWVATPGKDQSGIDALKIGEYDNPVHHYNYCANDLEGFDKYGEALLRLPLKKVEEAFIRYWGPIQKAHHERQAGLAVKNPKPEYLLEGTWRSRQPLL